MDPRSESFAKAGSITGASNAGTDACPPCFFISAVGVVSERVRSAM